MTKQELTAFFINQIETERIKKGLKQHEIAEKLEMSLAGYRKMISGQTDSISLFTAYKAAELFGKTLNSMCIENERNQTIDTVYRASESAYTRIKYYVSYQDQYRKHYEHCSSEGCKYVDLVIPNGFFKDGMILDSYGLSKLEVKNIYDEEIHKALKITENSLIPAYVKGDILLINETMARNGDISLLMNAKTRRFYIRRIIIKEVIVCEPLNGKGEDLIIRQEDRKEWIDFGHVVATLRE